MDHQLLLLKQDQTNRLQIQINEIAKRLWKLEYFSKEMETLTIEAKRLKASTTNAGHAEFFARLINGRFSLYSLDLP